MLHQNLVKSAVIPGGMILKHRSFAGENECFVAGIFSLLGISFSSTIDVIPWGRLDFQLNNLIAHAKLND